MKCDNCPAAWEDGGMTDCGYECDSYGCIIRGLYYGGEGESCYLTEEEIKARLRDWERYKAGEIKRPQWVVNRFMRELDRQAVTFGEPSIGLPPYYPIRMTRGVCFPIYGSTDMHYERAAAYRHGYEDAKAGKPMKDDYYAKHGHTEEVDYDV